MPKFITYDIPECEQINSDDGRRYRTPTGKIYPSVTTVLATLSNSYIAEWRRNIGEAEADRITSAAAKRGTKIHTWCECYLRHIGFRISPHDQEASAMFFNMRPELDKLKVIHALEQRLWSDKLRVAGTVDCIAEIDGEMYIVDFKTSRLMKNREDIPGYFMQCAAYAVAWYERTGMAISNGRVIITTQDDGIQIYDEPLRPWVGKFIELRSQIP